MNDTQYSRAMELKTQEGILIREMDFLRDLRYHVKQLTNYPDSKELSVSFRFNDERVGEFISSVFDLDLITEMVDKELERKTTAIAAVRELFEEL